MPVLTQKRTKILATVGPASESVEVLTRLVEAGANAFRINFSHGSNEQRDKLLQNIREVEKALDSPVAILGDLSGPKIRVGEIAGGSVELKDGASVQFQKSPVEGTADLLSVTLPELFDVIAVGDPVLLWDGRLRLRVYKVEPGERFYCTVEQGGELESRKGVNLPGTLLPISALTEKDRADAAWIAERDFDYVALSFVQKADDLHELRELLRSHGSNQSLVAKVEKPQALACINEIIEASDCIMVARGDLGVEMDFPRVPVAQKSIVEKCQAAGVPCIIATEMLESMITAPRPTRAEVSDVANAVFDNADAVMLSAESSVGQFPVEAVRAMRDTVRAAEAHQASRSRGMQLGEGVEPAALAALLNSFHVIHDTVDIATIAVITDSGRTARLVAKTRPPCSIVAFSPDIRAVRRASLFYGVVTLQVDVNQAATQRELVEHVKEDIRTLGLADKGDKILLTGHFPFGRKGSTNTLAIIDVD